ncbi:hypothetical protein QLQ15_09515 [Lysobacter sp. LF1]|uniref:Uncharacterized protein n=1 Tax=Lysobacter stagni TaxID=3045172 RepID=A0ABT6XG71_9GAMM|nr:hypothetical protein [Lysobacter sp. LF1]MDI9239147.1 hypothetical protein [Lysobacter sp. LF1]
MNVRLALLAGALVAFAPVAWAQQANTLQPPRAAPVPASPAKVDQSRDAGSLEKLNRDLDAASRRVQSDTLGGQIQRGDDQMDADRARIERQRAGATPAEQARLRQQYDLRRAEHDAWRSGKEQQQQRLETPTLPPPPPPNEVRTPQIEPRP